MKNQLKKSLSLLMAVLMILSCWVWVAPEKASAGAPNSYDVTINYNVTNPDGGGDTDWFKVYWIDSNGKETSNTTQGVGEKSLSLGTAGVGSATVTVPGWPCRVYIETNAAAFDDTGISLSTITINNVTVVEGTWSIGDGSFSSEDSREFIPNTRDNANADGKTGTVSGTTEGVWNWERPKLHEVVSTITGESHTLDKVNTGLTKTSTVSLGGAKDQYGVNWTGSLNSSFTLTDEDDAALDSSYASISQSGDTATVTIRPWLQTLFPDESGTTLKIGWSASNGKGGTHTINVDFPSYNATFYGNGGLIGANDAEATESVPYGETLVGLACSECKRTLNETETQNKSCATHGPGTVFEVYEGTPLYIGSKIGAAPAYASKPGYEFKGYYSIKNDDVPGKDANFAGTKFEDNVTKVPHTVGAEHGYESNEYNDTKFVGDTKWYAAWQAAPVDVTFITADNQHIATLTGRYDNYMTADNMYGSEANLNAAIKAAHTSGKVKFDSNNVPIYKDGATSFNFAGWKIVEADNIDAYDGIIDGKADGKIDHVKESPIDKDETFKLRGNVILQAVYTKADSKTYKIDFKDAEGKVISSQGGYKFRDQVINVPAVDPTLATDVVNSYEFIGWAKDIGKNYYTVDENNKDADGATIVYTHKDGAEFIVKDNATYVPVFRMIPREYSVKFNYYADNEVAQEITVGGYHWGDVPSMPEIKDNYTKGGLRYTITGWQADGSYAKPLNQIKVTGNMELTAAYGDVRMAEYVVDFIGKAEDGETDVHLNPENNIYEHYGTIVIPDVPQEIETDDALYTFVGWSPVVPDFALADGEYKAVYEKHTFADLYFYNYDGTLIYKLDGKENRFFEGETTIPLYANLVEKEDGTTENVLPSKAEDKVGTYNFTGWKDGAGNVVVPGTTVFTGDAHLVAQFETDYKEYTVKFVNEDVVVSEEVYHYGDEIVVPANPTKESDLEYTYEFRTWSPDISSVCHGNATYVATYRRTPIYYKVTWLKDDKTILAESNYQYNAKIQQAVIGEPINPSRPAGTGMTWVIDYWVQCDANGDFIYKDGETIRFQRGQRMPAEPLFFFPIYKEEANIITVTFYGEDGTTLLGEAKIPYGELLDDYDDEYRAMAPKKASATEHFTIEKWVNVKTDAEVDKAKENVSVKPIYKGEAHDKKFFEILSEPTATVPGYGHKKCDATECDAIEYNVAIAPVADTSAPIAQFYVGTEKWTTEQFADMDYNFVSYAGPNSSLIVNAQDIGSASEPWNKDGEISRGIGKISYYVSENRIDPSTVADADWTGIFDYEAHRQEALNYVLSEKKITLAEYTGYSNDRTPEVQMKKAEIDRAVDVLLDSEYANATSVLSNLNLTNGKYYIIYIKVTDRKGFGEANTAYLSSGTFNYGSTTAEIAIEGEGHATKFCADATITVTDDNGGFKVYLEGTEITLNADGEYTCTAAGVHNVTVIDRHGNKSSKIFEIKGNHTYKHYIKAETCETDGVRYDQCTVCGSKANVEVLPAKGHKYTTNFVDTAPDCVDNGTRTYVCDNNCGTTLVLNPADDAEKIAQASKWDEAAGEWVALEKADLDSLKATGVHTYAMVKDENGEDTAEFVWVIDKAANCITAGSKHRDCTVCGTEDGRITEVIPADTVNGHNYYREKVTTEASCEGKGYKTKTCRYCKDVVVVEEYAPLGHIEGKYVEVTAATCETEGAEKLTCGRCSTDENPVFIGEPIKDANGKVTGFDINAVKPIKALGHAYKVQGKVYEKDGKYYQLYVCKNDSKHTEEREVQNYVPPVAATVKFDFNGGKLVIPAIGTEGEDGYVAEQILTNMVIDGNVGDTISASEINVVPVKAADDTKTYTFSHWVDAEGKEVNFPIDVKGDATYKAVYAERYINYTITYFVEVATATGTEIKEYKKTGYLHNGDEVALSAGPSKAETNREKYEFAGWKAADGTVYKDKITVNAADISLTATYTSIPKKYAVTYAYSKNDIIHTYTVEAGKPAPDVTRDFGEIKKAFDSKYHYTFKEWNKHQQLNVVESNIYTTPDFDAASHVYTVTEKTPATCTTNRIDTYTCACGHSYDKEEPNTALGHLWGDSVYDETTGKNTVKCMREGCGIVEADTRTFTAKFYTDATDTKALKTISYITWGSKIDSTRLPAAPTKESTATTDYTFKGWAVKGDATKTVVDFAELVIKADADFVAVFDETARIYSVIFAYEAENEIEIHTNVKAGDSVTFGGAVPTKACDDNYHYTFKGWKGYEGSDHKLTITNVQSDLYILADFTRVKHTYTPSELTEATCQNGAGTRYWCNCNANFDEEGNPKFDDKVNGDFVDHYYDVTGKPLKHEWVEVDRVEATPDKAGYIKYECDNCDETYEEALEYEDNKIDIRVYVEHNGAPEVGAKVELQIVGAPSISKSTGTNGYVTFTVDKDGVYTCFVYGKQVTLEKDGEGFLGIYSYSDSASCTCACHRTNFWGTIFRFFHKIIKFFAGEYKCCNNPDPMYG